MNRVLVVEADPTTRAQVDALVARAGFTPVSMGEAAGAFATLAAADAPCIVVLSRQLPDADGLELLRWLRRQPAHASTWVLMLTGHDRREDEVAALEAGADDFLVKPVDSVRLRAHLRVGARRVGVRGDAPGRAAA